MVPAQCDNIDADFLQICLRQDTDFSPINNKDMVLESCDYINAEILDPETVGIVSDARERMLCFS